METQISYLQFMVQIVLVTRLIEMLLFFMKMPACISCNCAFKTKYYQSLTFHKIVLNCDTGYVVSLITSSKIILPSVGFILLSVLQ